MHPVGSGYASPVMAAAGKEAALSQVLLPKSVEIKRESMIHLGGDT